MIRKIILCSLIILCLCSCDDKNDKYSIDVSEIIKTYKVEKIVVTKSTCLLDELGENIIYEQNEEASFDDLLENTSYNAFFTGDEIFHKFYTYKYVLNGKPSGNEFTHFTIRKQFYLYNYKWQYYELDTDVGNWRVYMDSSFNDLENLGDLSSICLVKAFASNTEDNTAYFAYVYMNECFKVLENNYQSSSNYAPIYEF